MKTEFKGYDRITKEEMEKAMDFAVKSVVANLEKFTDRFQNAFSENGFYKPIDNKDWTNGFWTGEIWLAYEYVRDQKKRAEQIHEKQDFAENVISLEQAEQKIEEQERVLEKLVHAGNVQIDSFMDRIVKKVSVDHHDMGFLYSPSCVAGYKLTGSEAGKQAAILAAQQLITRFQPKGEFLQAWGSMDEAENYRLIIDCLLNLPLLYWASEVTGEEKYRTIAQKHIHTAVKNVIRSDFSTWHTFFFDPKTGKPDHGATCQGYRDGSAWTRGQAWGIYGMALAYKYTKKEEYIDIFRHVTEYFLARMPKDLIPYWDLEFTSGEDQPRDSSSASIAACGMLEMAKYLSGEEQEYYRTVAGQLMKAVYDRCAVKDLNQSNGLVLHSTYSNHSPYNTCNHYGVDECNSWGDYFYMEALTRMQKDWDPYW